MEVKEDLMLSPSGESKPTLRIAHFLKPISNSIHEPPFDFNPFSSSSSVSEPKEYPLKIHFSGWRNPYEKWFRWVDQLKLKYESVWKKAGIFDAIMTTKCYIPKDQNLLFRVVEKWCYETNTFVFPFGEATITLEDVMVLGGYPVIGDPIFISLEDQEMREVENKLILARQQLTNRKHHHAYTSMWMDMFVDKGSEIEHEAFLATWLSIFVFPHNRMVNSSLFPIVVHLARGNPIALAPAVLASLYKDLTLFKKTIVDLSKHPDAGDIIPMEVTFQSPNKVTVAQYNLQCHSYMPARAEDRETVEEKEIKETEDEVTMLLKEQHLKTQGELARVVRQQEEILRLLALREKRDEMLRQLLTSVLRNKKDQYLKNQEELRHVARQHEEILRLLSLREKRDEELRQIL